MSLKIGIFTHYIDKYPNKAPSLYQLELIKRLSQIKNLEIVLIHHNKSNILIYKELKDVIIPRIPYLREQSLNKLNVDLIHLNAIPWSWWPSVSKINKPVITTVHGTIHWDNESLDEYSLFILRPIKRYLEKKVSKYITYFIAISNHVRNVLIKKLGIPGERIEVIYLPVDLDIFRPINDKSAMRRVLENYGIEKDYILHVSAYSKRKNPFTLLKVFSIVRTYVEDIDLVIVGPGWRNKYVLKLLKEFNLENSVKILGWVPREDLTILYNCALLFFFPSLHENFGFPLVEAMACGCPVVTSNVFAIPEIVDNAAIMCEPYDYNCFSNAIIKILEDKVLRYKLKEKGIERARVFSWETHINKIIDLYNRVLSTLDIRI